MELTIKTVGKLRELPGGHILYPDRELTARLSKLRSACKYLSAKSSTCKPHANRNVLMQPS